VDNTADLRVLLASEYPLILAETKDEQRFLSIVRRVAAELDIPVWTWSSTRGLAKDGFDPQYRTADPRRALDWVATLTIPGVFVFADAHTALNDPVVVRHAKEIAQGAKKGQTLVLTGPSRKVPAELQGLAVPWALKPPSEDELERLVRRTMFDLSGRGLPVELNDGEVTALAATLRGLSISDAERLIQRAAFETGGLDGTDLAGVRAAKAELLNVDGVLELVEAEVGSLDQIGGLDGIKEWLQRRQSALATGGAGLDPLRGILLTGIPGCGKSLVAKTLARTWEQPLVLLDPARLYGSYIGESEQRLATALSTVDAMAPVVLWIDEIEKGFASGGRADGGVSERLLGSFLRWMQDRSDDVFLVATANDVTSLPPELLRKGRFDELFFIDLPDAVARRDIFAIQLTKREHDPAGFDLTSLAEASRGYSGAEIEAAVVGALYRALAGGKELSTEEIVVELGSTVPLSISRAEDVAALREWGQQRAIAA